MLLCEDAEIEPVVEMTQVKGTSDTHPLLSPNDEWADFEIMEARIGSIPPAFSFPAGGYVRDAYIRGLMSNQFGTGNPYKFGLIGASDSSCAWCFGGLEKKIIGLK